MQATFEDSKNYELCHHCDLLSEIPTLKDKHKAVCPRCHTQLARKNNNMKRDSIIFSSCALFLLILACGFMFIDIRVMGIVNRINLLNIADILYEDNYLLLTTLFLLLILVIPIACLAIQILLCSVCPIPKSCRRYLLKVYTKFQGWSMPEIFMAGVLVSFVKLGSYGDVQTDKAFWIFVLFTFFYLKSVTLFSKYQLWNDVAGNNFMKVPLITGATGLSQNMRLCLCCHAMLPSRLSHCPRCKTQGQLRERNKIQWTMALLLTSIILYIPANLFAVMNTVFLGSMSSSTILDGILYMWKDGDYPVALVIFSASVIIPILKILALSWLCYFVIIIKDNSYATCLKMNKIYNMIEIIGRWSMIDVFVVSVVSAMIRNGEMMAVYPYIGIIFFASVVIFTMIAAHKYDPRLIWDNVNYKG